MCAMCDGQTAADFMADVVDDIRCVGWAVIAVEDGQGRHVRTYTAGLTRYHGHPEIVVSGADFTTAHRVVDALAEIVRGGRRLRAGDEVDAAEAGRRCVMVRVAVPARLAVAQALYASGRAPVPALQAVWADERGRWPWEVCEHERDGQRLYGDA